MICPLLSRELRAPIANISPQLARAGFYFNPHPSTPDNVRCFLCHKELDGWEPDDDPLAEHLKHSSGCGWAICAAIEVELGDSAKEDPRQPHLLDARKATFAGHWPYEGKKGWKCKTKQVWASSKSERRVTECRGHADSERPPSSLPKQDGNTRPRSTLTTTRRAHTVNWH